MDAVEYDAADGVTKILEFLQENIGADALTDLCDKIKAFMEVKRRSDQTVRDYVFEFDNAYTVARSKAKLPEIPGAYLMYVLIKNAKISDHDRKIVLSAIDLKKPAEIYKDTKMSLLKFCGEMTTISCSQEGAGAMLSPEVAFWSTRGGRPGSSGGARGHGNFWRGSFSGKPGKKRTDMHSVTLDPSGFKPEIQRDNMVLDGKKHNAKKFGKVMTCDYCGSYLHLANKCWEKQRNKGNYKTYAAVDEEDDQFHDCQDYDSDEEEAHMSHNEGFMEGEDEEPSDLVQVWEQERRPGPRLTSSTTSRSWLPPSRTSKGSSRRLCSLTQVVSGLSAEECGWQRCCHQWIQG